MIYFSKRLFSGIKTVIITLISTVLFSTCSKDDLPELRESHISINPGINLVSALNLGSVSVSNIKSIAQVAGYPQFNDYMKYSIRLVKIVYRTSYKGDTILASGVVSYPFGINESFPSLIVGNGLIFADREAPSEFKLPDRYSGFEFIASMGYFTIIPDMIGFGESKDLLYPIHNYEHSASTMIDFILAVEEFIQQVNIQVNEKKILTGYSQGAFVALSALKMIEENPDLGIQIDAAAVGAGAFNLITLLDYALENNKYTAPSHLIMLLSSYNEIYEWNRPLTDFFNDKYAEIIPELLSGQYTRAEVDPYLTNNLDSLLNPVFLQSLINKTETQIIEAFEENCVDDWAPQTKLKIIHSLFDDRIPVFDSENTYKKMQDNGSENVEFELIETAGHVNAGFDFVEIVLNWFNDINL